MVNSFNETRFKIVSILNNFNDLHEIRLKNPNRLIFAHININSLRNKFEMLQEVIGNNIDVLLISETELDASFSFKSIYPGWIQSTYGLDRMQHGGGIMLFIWEGIPSRLLNADTSISGIENL